MKQRVQLREVAHARAGDKGNTSNVAVFVNDPALFDTVAAQLTSDRLKEELGDLLRGEITRYELPQVQALNFVMQEGLEGGVNESLNLDGHGKSWSSLILGLQIEV